MLTINNVWMMVSIFLVFIMHLGFSTLEAGFVRSKNTVNILFKNVLIISIGLLIYYAWGFNLMYPGADYAGQFFGFAGFGLSAPMVEDENGVMVLDLAYNEGYTYWTDFLFQAMFAATAATIVSGAVAERIKLSSFFIFSILFVGLVYPIVGMWHWGGGWLNALGFYDFAGSTLVHSVGGWGALAGVILLGARKGKYDNGKVNAIPGHSLPLSTIGVFLLWLGWFGFNGGSVLSADASAVSRVLVTTSIAAAAGVVGAAVMAFIKFKNYDLGMALNGALAGLVGITAGADLMTVGESIIIGLVAGVLIVLGVIFFDQILKLDDPVGATSVHLINGIWGTLAVGILGEKAGMQQFLYQLAGVAAAGVFAFGMAFIIFFALKKIAGIRVSEQEELDGLDLQEHGIESYPDFRLI